MPTSIRPDRAQERAAAEQAKKQAEMAEAEESSRLEYLQLQYDRNKKKINIALAVVVLAVAGFFGWKYFAGQNEEKASAKMFYAQQYFAKDSMSRALNGDGQHPGFLRIIKDYGSTKAGNLAHYYAGVAYMKTGNFKKSIDMLEAFDGKGTMVGTMAEGKLGDAYMESGNAAKAIDHYKKATSNKDDQTLTPLFLLNLGIAYEQNKQPDEAIKAYKRIRDEYPQTMQARDVDRYLAMLGVLE